MLLLQHNRSTVIRQLRSTPLKPINQRVIVPVASTYVFVDPEQQSVVEAGYARMQCVPFGCILKPESEVVVRFRGYRLLIGRTPAKSQLD